MSAYKDLDEAIYLHIASGSNRHPIYCGFLLDFAESELGLPLGSASDKVWRLIDRRLQALKKAGRIRYERPNWMAIK